MNMQCNQPVVRLNPALNVACQPLGLILLLLISLLADVSIASETILIDDFSCLDSWKVTQEPAAIEACEGEAAGNAAMRIRMPGMVRKNFGTYWFSGSEEIEMDTVEGVSFKSRGMAPTSFPTSVPTTGTDIPMSLHFPSKIHSGIRFMCAGRTSSHKENSKASMPAKPPSFPVL